MSPNIKWPDGKKFAFTVFDDTDAINENNVHPVYSFLKDLGFRTTKSVWTYGGPRDPLYGGLTCENEQYLNWLKELQAGGFEIGYHMATYHSSFREEIIHSLEKFYEFFEHNPRTVANHSNCKDNIYWGIDRVSGDLHRFLYHAMNRFSNGKAFEGHVEGSRYFWGDLCREKVDYVRNFVYKELNTLKVCPCMPYYDTDRPYVRNWFSSCEGATVKSFVKRITEENVERLEEENGACIMYTHFSYGFYENGRINSKFARLMENIAKKDAWLVPVSTLLDYIRVQRGEYVITPEERKYLERKWLINKILLGST